jgi:hypothetical protein
MRYELHSAHRYLTCPQGQPFDHASDHRDNNGKVSHTGPSSRLFRALELTLEGDL